MTYLEDLLPARISRLTSWIALSTAAAVTLLISNRYQAAPVLIGTFLPLALCIGLVPLAMRGICSVLANWMNHVPDFLDDSSLEFDCREWTRLEFARFSASPSQWRLALVYTIPALFVYSFAGAFDGLPALVAILCVLVTFIAVFECGVGLFSTYWLARYVWRVGKKYAVRVAPHAHGVLSTGRMLVQCYALVALVGAVCTSSATWAIRSPWIPILVMALPAVMFFTGSFVVCQFPLHVRIVEYKRKKLMELDDLINQLTPKTSSDVTQERQHQIDFCVAEMTRINKLPNWPFGVGALSGTLGVSLGTVATPLFQQMLLPILLKSVGLGNAGPK